MEKKRKILESRERLDKTLALPDLINKESIRSLVEDQLLRSTFCATEGDFGNVVQKRTIELSNFLGMLRSASGNEGVALKDYGTSERDWKIKQDTDQLRVMYREGPHGTPFHTLLCEGYADGPIDVCLCASWESTLYKKWWPQYSIPTFKIIMSTCLQKVRIGEEISLIRMKVPWPVSDREALLHYFEVEYLKEDLVLVLLNTISNTENIDLSTHGFTNEGIPEAKDTVRVDLVGGFALQKVSSDKCYFRVIANMDIKLDFVPPSLINFISRQLIGNGHKLYQKAVASVATSDEDYQQALKGPMYVRIREGLDSYNKPKTDLVGLDEEKPIGLLTQEHTVQAFVEKSSPVRENTFITEIVEEEPEQSPSLEGNQLINDSSTDLITEPHHFVKERTFVSPEVEQALGILDSAIAIVCSRGFYDSQSDCSSVDQELPTTETVAKAVCSPERGAPKVGNMDMLFSESGGRSATENSRSNGVCSSSREANHEQHAPSSLKEKFSIPGNTQEDKLRSSNDTSINGIVTMTQPPMLDIMSKVCDEGSLKANGTHENNANGGKFKQNKNKKQRLCCFNLSLIRG